MTSASTPRPRWTPLAIGYLVLALAGLVGTWWHNLAAITQQVDFLGDWFDNGPAVSSLTTDLLVVAVAASILMAVEGRRLGIRFAWVLIPLSALTALAFTFPLFLALRERRLAGTGGETTTAPDRSGAAV